MNCKQYETPPLFLTDKQANLLAVAESIVYSSECENHCVHFEEGIFPCECRHFACADGYLICDGYKQEGGDDGY